MKQNSGNRTNNRYTGFVNRTGQQFGELIAERYYRDNKGKTYWECRCVICDKIKDIRADRLHSSKKCGCTTEYKKDPRYGHIYSVWKHMHQRCAQEKRENYRFYGAKGINVCEEWSDISNFYIWAITNGYDKQLQLDRINSKKDYSPGNCRWLVKKDNIARIHKKDVVVTKKGKSIILTKGIRYQIVKIYRKLHKMITKWYKKHILKQKPSTFRRKNYYNLLIDTEDRKFVYKSYKECADALQIDVSKISYAINKGNGIIDNYGKVQRITREEYVAFKKGE